MRTKILLLIIGVLGIVASIFGVLKGQDITTHLIGFVCATCLVYGYFEFKKLENEER